MKNILCLFDIDGTLIRGAQRENPKSPSLAYAFEKVYGIKDFNFIDYPTSDGTTDYHIVVDVCTKNGLKEIEITDKYEEFLEACIERLKDFPDYQKFLLPGIKIILGVLAKRRITCGVLTGNGKKKGQWKLKATGLDKWLRFGAYGDFFLNRNDLFPVALKEAEEFSGKKFSRENIFIIGDTKHDIEVAKANGAVAVAVATGRSTVEELKAFGADFVFSDLTKTKEFLTIIGL